MRAFVIIFLLALGSCASNSTPENGEAESIVLPEGEIVRPLSGYEQLCRDYPDNETFCQGEPE